MPRSTAVRISDGSERQSKANNRPTWVEELEEAERERRLKEEVTAEESVEHQEQIDDLHASLDALEDVTNGVISEAEYNAIVAAYEAKYPQPQLSFKKREPWESISSNLSPELRKLAWQNSINNAAKNATKSANENHGQPVAPSAFTDNPSKRCPVAVLLPSSPILSTAASAHSSTGTPSASAKRVLTAANENRKPWTKASNVQKFHGSIQVAEYENGFAFSLNLSPARIKKLMADAANGNDPKRRLSHDLNRYLKKHLGYTPPYSFGFEFDGGGRLHTHGSVIVEDRSEPVRKLLHMAFSAAGGKIKGRTGSTQAHSTEITYGTGWFRYTTKSLSRTRTLLGIKDVTFISGELKHMTRKAWESSLLCRETPAAEPVPAQAASATASAAKRSPCRSEDGPRWR